MRQILAAVLLAGCLTCSPAHAQLASSPWPKQFQGNENRSRSSATGPTNSNLAVADSTYITNPSTATIGPGPNHYVYVTSSGTGSAALYEYSITGSYTFSLNWYCDLSSISDNVSAPTIDANGYAWIGGTKFSYSSPPYTAQLIRVDLTGMSHTASSIDVTSDPNGAEGADASPPAIDSDGTVYVCTRSMTSSGMAGIVAVDSSMSELWAHQMDGTDYLHSNPVDVYALALKDGGVSGTHQIYINGSWVDYGLPANEGRKHKLTRIDASLAGGASVIFEWDETAQVDMTYNTNIESWNSYPVLSDNGSYFYCSRIYSPVMGSPECYLQARSTSDGTLSNEIGVYSTNWYPDSVAVDSGGYVYCNLFGVSIFNRGLTSSSGGLSLGSRVTPSLDASDNVYGVNSSGDVVVAPSGGSSFTVTGVGANAQITVRDSNTIVVPYSSGYYSGLALLH